MPSVTRVNSDFDVDRGCAGEQDDTTAGEAQLLGLTRDNLGHCAEHFTAESTENDRAEDAEQSLHSGLDSLRSGFWVLIHAAS
jgi:hypothetical protein